MLHIPLLRKGQPYKSGDRVMVTHHCTREPFVEIREANVGRAAAAAMLQAFRLHFRFQRNP